MVSVCTTCKGLQKHLRALDGSAQELESGPQQWLSTTLPSLRRSTNGGCRACAVLLQGILLHHERFAEVKEEDIRITAESFHLPTTERTEAQDHLSIEVRWEHPGDDCGDEDEHVHEEGYPDLKLEFFTDGGKSLCPS